MKRLFLMLMVAVLSFALVACGGNEEPASGTNNVTQGPTGGQTGGPTGGSATENPANTPAGTPEDGTPTEAPTETPTEVPTAAPTEDPTANLGYSIPYVVDGLVALYEGYYNTRSGLNPESTVWENLSPMGDLDILNVELSDAIKFSENGLFLDCKEIVLPDGILSLVNSEAFTVEMKMDSLVAKGRDYNTFLNNSSMTHPGNDHFSLFIRKNDNCLEFKSNNTPPQRPKRSGDAREICAEGCTITVTFESYGFCELYVDGELMGSMSAPASVDANGVMFLGYADADKYFSANFVSLRFYNRVLDASEIEQNAAAGRVTAK